jgi:hypothetical protein
MTKHDRQFQALARRIKDLPGSCQGGVITDHDREFQALACRIKDLPRGAPSSLRRMDYLALALFVSCLLVFDTQTWLQRLLLLFLALSANKKRAAFPLGRSSPINRP